MTTPLLKFSSEDEPVKHEKNDDTISPAAIAAIAPATVRAASKALSGILPRPSKKP